MECIYFGNLYIIPGAGFTKPLRLTKAGLSDYCIQKMHALVRKSSFSKAQGLR